MNYLKHNNIIIGDKICLNLYKCQFLLYCVLAVFVITKNDKVMLNMLSIVNICFINYTK